MDNKLTEHLRIDATELIQAKLSPDSTRLQLTLRDQDGQSVSLSLPLACLNTILTAAPRQAATDEVHRLDSWTMDHAEAGNDIVLTLRTPEGLAISFNTKRWQIEGMATIATYGMRPTSAKRLH
jgi:hypothetical protein